MSIKQLMQREGPSKLGIIFCCIYTVVLIIAGLSYLFPPLKPFVNILSIVQYPGFFGLQLLNGLFGIMNFINNAIIMYGVLVLLNYLVLYYIGTHLEILYNLFTTYIKKDDNSDKDKKEKIIE